MDCKTNLIIVMQMKKILAVMLACFVCLCAYAEFQPYCSGDDGVSYVQGHTETSGNGTPTIYLDGYGKYKNATVQVIVYSKGWDGVEREWYRETVKIREDTVYERSSCEQSKGREEVNFFACFRW